MEILGGLLGSSGGQNLISGILSGILGGGSQSNPLSALLGGGGHGQGDSISKGSNIASTIMDVAQIAALFA